MGSLHCLLTCETNSLIIYLNSILHKNAPLESYSCASHLVELLRSDCSRSLRWQEAGLTVSHSERGFPWTKWLNPTYSVCLSNTHKETRYNICSVRFIQIHLCLLMGYGKYLIRSHELCSFANNIVVFTPRSASMCKSEISFRKVHLTRKYHLDSERSERCRCIKQNVTKVRTVCDEKTEWESHHICTNLVFLCALRLLDERIHVFTNNFSGYLYMKNSESSIMIQVMLPSVLHSFLNRNYYVERILDSCTWKKNWKRVRSGKPSVCFHLARECGVEEERHVGFWGFRVVMLQENEELVRGLADFVTDTRLLDNSENILKKMFSIFTPILKRARAAEMTILN